MGYVHFGGGLSYLVIIELEDISWRHINSSVPRQISQLCYRPYRSLTDLKMSVDDWTAIASLVIYPMNPSFSAVLP